MNTASCTMFYECAREAFLQPELLYLFSRRHVCVQSRAGCVFRGLCRTCTARCFVSWYSVGESKKSLLAFHKEW